MGRATDCTRRGPRPSRPLTHEPPRRARAALSGKLSWADGQKGTAARRSYSTPSPFRDDPCGASDRGDRGSAERRGGERDKGVETVCLVVRVAPRGVKVAISRAFWGKSASSAISSGEAEAAAFESLDPHDPSRQRNALWWSSYHRRCGRRLSRAGAEAKQPAITA